jgi:hypothetical protein
MKNINQDKVIDDVIQTPVQVPDADLVQLAEKISEEINKAKRSLAININSTITETYWKVGRYIVEFEQDGKTKAKYGTSLLTRLSKLLRIHVGRGYSRPNLNNMRKFYLTYPICQTVSDKLTWSHICEWWSMQRMVWIPIYLFRNMNYSCPTRRNYANWL